MRIILIPPSLYVRSLLPELPSQVVAIVTDNFSLSPVFPPGFTRLKGSRKHLRKPSVQLQSRTRRAGVPPSSGREIPGSEPARMFDVPSIMRALRARVVVDPD